MIQDFLKIAVLAHSCYFWADLRLDPNSEYPLRSFLKVYFFWTFFKKSILGPYICSRRQFGPISRVVWPQELSFSLLEGFRSTDRVDGSMEWQIFVVRHYFYVSFMKTWSTFHSKSNFSIIPCYLGSIKFRQFSLRIAIPYSNPIHSFFAITLET